MYADLPGKHGLTWVRGQCVGWGAGPSPPAHLLPPSLPLGPYQSGGVCLGSWSSNHLHLGMVPCWGSGLTPAPGSPRFSPSRLPPGAGLVERIQAIAQNVSDIAVKVDQILRHSLLLHSKGGCGGPPGDAWREQLEGCRPVSALPGKNRGALRPPGRLRVWKGRHQAGTLQAGTLQWRLWGLLPLARSSASFPLPPVSEGRRDQCEAPSDPKFPDCAGKVEVRPESVAGVGDQKAIGGISSAPRWAFLPRASAQPCILTLAQAD